MLNGVIGLVVGSFDSTEKLKRAASRTENAIAKEIVDAAFRIHTTLGPGLLESVYDTVLAYELGRRGLRTARQQPIPVVYENVRIDTGFRADLIVEDKVIVDLRINFHVALIKDGITRVVNGLEDDVHAKSPSRKDP